jgi:hypothetical protein
MKNLKKFTQTLPIIGVIICSIAFFTPASFFENIVWNHTIINWIWGFYSDQYNMTIINRFYSHPLQIIPSLICSVIFIVCLGITGILSYKIIKKKEIMKTKYLLIPPILMILSVIIWMIMMEIAELVIYDFSMWNRYIPNFGLIGMYLGSLIIIIGFTLVKKYQLLEKKKSKMFE